MNFELPEELRMLRDMSCKFANAEFTPFSRECDEEERYTPEIRKKAAENGLVGAWIPEEYGGAGVGILGNTIITEEISRVDMGIRASDTAEIALEDVTVPRENLVGEEKKGFRQLMHFFDVTRVMVAGQAVGLSQSCLDESIKYSKERTAFGSPIGIFQSTMTKLTEMAIRIEALRNLVYKAAWSIDEGRPDYHLAAIAKYYGGQTAVFCANAAVEIHGGYGYIDEYKVQKLYRDAKILELYEGTKEAEIMTIGRFLLSR